MNLNKFYELPEDVIFEKLWRCKIENRIDIPNISKTKMKELAKIIKISKPKHLKQYLLKINENEIKAIKIKTLINGLMGSKMIN